MTARHDWDGGPTVVYGDGDEFDGATFLRVCPECGRFVTAHNAQFDWRGQPVGANATCIKHGEVAMPFVGYP